MFSKDSATEHELLLPPIALVVTCRLNHTFHFRLFLQSYNPVRNYQQLHNNTTLSYFM